MTSEVRALYKASAPGSLMLLGEYAVLHDKTAIVCAIDQRIHVTLKPRQDDQLIIHSALKNHTTTVHNIIVEPPLTFVLATLKEKQSALPSGCDLFIDAEFPSHLGLGSSAAVSVALMMALNVWLQQAHLTKESLWQQVKKVVLAVQGKASGADIAASIYGGVIGFENNPFNVTRLLHYPKLCAVYSGHKTTTQKAIDIVKQRYLKNPSHFEDLFSRIDTLSHAGMQAINEQDWNQLGELLNRAQDIMVELGVCHQILGEVTEILRQQPDITGAKISGAGLGDCAIGIGHIAPQLFPHNEQQKKRGVQQISVTIGCQGVTTDDH